MASNLGDVFAQEYDREHELFIQHHGIRPEEVEPSLLRLRHMEERAFFYWADSMSASGASGDRAT